MNIARRLIISQSNLAATLASFSINKNLTSVLSKSLHPSKPATSIRFQSNGESASVDHAEMERFEKLARLWWIENGSYEPLHRLNSLRVPLVKDTLINNNPFLLDNPIGQPLLGINILDIGCGGGILSEALARLGANVTGVDACTENVLSAQIRAESQYNKTKSEMYERLRYINCTVESLAEVEDNHGYFDAVVMSEVVEHVNNLEGFLKDSSILLKNHGFSFITTINRTPQSYLLGILAAENILGLVPKGTHTWEKFVKPEELVNFLEKSQMYIKFQTGMGYNPVTKKWFWQDNSSINYAMYAQKQSHD